MTRKLKLLFLVLSVLWTMFIFSNSMASAEQSSQNSGVIVTFLLNFIKNIDVSFLTFIIRKLGHFLEFFVQGMFIGFTFLLSAKFTKNIIYILFFGLLSAVTDEFIQLFSPGRDAMVQDVLIDFSGTVVACLICILIYSVLKRKRMINHE